MENKKTVILLSMAIIGAIIATSGLTYAYLSYSETDKTANTMSTACFDVGFSDGSSSISLLGYPMSVSKAKTLTPYTFTVTENNSCTTATSFDIYLGVKNTSGEKLINYVDYSFDKSETDKHELKSLQPVDNLPTGVTKDESITTFYKIGSDEIGGEKSTLQKNLYLWIDEEAGNDIMGQKFEAEVLIYSFPKSN